MSGTKEGGRLTTETCKAKYGEDYYALIGSRGGSKRVPKGFSMNRELASLAGALGGKISRRGKSKKTKVTHSHWYNRLVSRI